MRKRRLDPVSLVAGLVIMGLGSLLLLDRAGDLDLDFALAAPAVLAALGAILLVTGLTRGREK